MCVPGHGACVVTLKGPRVDGGWRDERLLINVPATPTFCWSGHHSDTHESSRPENEELSRPHCPRDAAVRALQRLDRDESLPGRPRELTPSACGRGAEPALGDGREWEDEPAIRVRPPGLPSPNFPGESAPS